MVVLLERGCRVWGQVRWSLHGDEGGADGELELTEINTQQRSSTDLYDDALCACVEVGHGRC